MIYMVIFCLFKTHFDAFSLYICTEEMCEKQTSKEEKEEMLLKQVHIRQTCFCQYLLIKYSKNGFAPG